MAGKVSIKKIAVKGPKLSKESNKQVSNFKTSNVWKFPQDLSVGFCKLFYGRANVGRKIRPVTIKISASFISYNHKKNFGS